MRKYIYFALLFLGIIFVSGCGGGGTNTGSDNFVNPTVDIENPAPESPDLDGSEVNQGEGTTNVDAAADIVLIKGVLVSAEGVGIPDATITFHSDPVQVITDAGGMFEAFLEVGSHTFEATSSAIGDISGSIVVSATGLVNEAGQNLGSFVAEVQSAVGEWITCAAPTLADVIGTWGGNTAVGIWEGTFGHEVDAQGYNQTAIITGNSEMIANISIDGRLSGLWFPTVGAYNHIPYLSGVDDWVKPFQGSFGGIKRGEDYYWFTDEDYWEKPEISYNYVYTAPIIEIIHDGKGDCSGATIKEKIYVDYDAYVGGGGRANVLIRDFQITSPWNLNLLCQTSSNSSYSPELTLYARFNPNSKHQLFHEWTPQLDDRECRNDRMYWTSLVTSNYAIVMEGMDSWGRKQGMTCTGIYNVEDARKIVPDTECFPLSVAGSIITWDIPTFRRVFVVTAGCDASGDPCDHALDDIESNRPITLESQMASKWTSWLSGIESVSNTTWRERYKRWLVTLKMLADRNTGAIIAAPSQEPTYYYSWPRDGVYQSLAYIMAGKYEEAANFFIYLFDMAQNWDGGWTQAHSSLDGSDLGLPASPLRLSVEEDQPPTVLWGLWVYWKEAEDLPTGITIADIKEVANYVVSRICLNSGLIWPSLDWHENPYNDIGQSLYTNATAHAGLLAAAEMVEEADAPAAETYRSAAQTIKNGVKNHLCPGGVCHARKKYDPLWIGFLGDPIIACGHCLDGPFSDGEREYSMAFAWPFHLFDLDGIKVQSYYDRTKNTHDDLSDFSRENSLWIPHYLYSYLYALEATNNDEVPDGSFKTGLLSDISEVESNFPDLITDVGYLMDQFVDGEEHLIYGPEYAGQKLGSAARPLGWSQAMGILSALARDGKRVPMIEIPFSCTDECMAGTTKCEGGSIYNCITDSSGCLVWDAGTACSSGACADATHCAGCTPHDHNACYDNDVYSFDSCGVRELLVYDCGDNEWTGSPYCQYGHVYQSYTERGCSDVYADCVASSITKKKEDCGTAGCVSGACCSDNASYSCYSNDVYWYSSCGNRQSRKEDCGSSGYTGSDYCYSGDVYRNYVTRGCSSDHCTSTTEQRLQDDCGSAGCSGGSCNSGGCSPTFPWTNNTLTLEKVITYGVPGVRISWNDPSPDDWPSHYIVARNEGGGTPPPTAPDTIFSIVPMTMDYTAVEGRHYTYVVYAYHPCDPDNNKAASQVRSIDF